MQYNFLRDILSSPWQIDALTYNTYSPMLRGMLTMGLHLENSAVDEKYKPYQVSASCSNEASDSNVSKISVVPLRGLMLKDDSASGVLGTKSIAENLLAADKKSDVIGHILLIESGGGQATAVQPLVEAIQTLSKPIVAWVDGTMCSAAMWVGSQCKEIIASHDADSIGCIGTVIDFGGFPKFNKEPDGYIRLRVYSDGSDQKNEEFEAELEQNFQLVKERILNPWNEQFCTAIRTNRPKAKDEELKGRTFRANEVVGTLIDSIGEMSLAIERVTALSQHKPKNHINMSKNLKLTCLLACLALTELASEDGNTSLNEEQLEAVEKDLAAGAKAAADLTEANRTIATRDKTIAENSKTIAELNAKIEEMGGDPGAESATVKKKQMATRMRTAKQPMYTMMFANHSI